jgi:hypothetical protein
MAPVTDDQANKVLRPRMQAMLRRGEFPFPVCLLYFTMQNNEGRYTWIAEPVLEDGHPVLTYHGEADAKKLDKEALDSIIDKINLWFDAMPADARNVSCDACDTVLYGESFRPIPFGPKRTRSILLPLVSLSVSHARNRRGRSRGLETGLGLRL